MFMQRLEKIRRRVEAAETELSALLQDYRRMESRLSPAERWVVGESWSAMARSLILAAEMIGAQRSTAEETQTPTRKWVPLQIQCAAPYCSTRHQTITGQFDANSQEVIPPPMWSQVGSFFFCPDHDPNR